MADELNRMLTRIHDLSDEDLIALVERDSNKYTPEAITAAELEVEMRGGLTHVHRERAPAPSKGRAQERFSRGINHFDELFSKLIGRAPSESYPGISYISIAMRLIGFLVATLSVGGIVISLVSMLFGTGGSWLISMAASMQAGIAFILFYGASELINLVLDIEQNTRRGDRS